ncbi:chromosome transmission fidelity protein 18 homolog isoform X2 [Citrus clementina]|uniref:chromosome transmission fidelity protein 18 homolog isoform X2 n=1 Tax=Citrus clementina TaxID=85681 RepID=UPI000CED4652|nr:chromosome transmission fidelity protein 18 homolog isoform X2 [Citrus x clementina]
MDMDMDMYMHIPLPEELELLEANYQDLDPPEQDPDPPEPVPPDSLPLEINGHKRPRSDTPKSPIDVDEPQFDEKRSRIVDNDDEDWLRYSPPPPQARDDARVEVEEKFVSRYASEIDGDCLPVTAPSGGDRVYVKISSSGVEERVKKLDVRAHSNSLTSEPIDVLLQKVEQEAFNKALNSSSEGQRDRSLPEKPVVHEQLWVDKYAPNSFTELLSDEQTNREVLLLCGPPGLGKTTLAHVAAKHCGYHVVEVNASDDRSSSTIENKILDVVQMNSVMADSRPKCLVIDEIDGALGDGKGAVEVILKMVSAERKSNTAKENVAKEDQSEKISKKKGRKKASLLRPVICICNDLYAPALRSLRQIAKVHVFIQPSVSRVVSRLKYICNNEGMKTSSIALTTLAEYTECDIRSCLNTLQFLDKKKEILNVMDIGSQVVGRKDMSRSAFDIWKEIFQKRKTKRLRNSVSSSSNVSNEFDFLHSLISNRGDYDVIFDGIHENILQLQYHDPVMLKTVKCLDCLGNSDLMHQYIMRTQQMPLYVYQPPLAITVHRLVSQIQKPNLEWPKSYQRYRNAFMEKMDIFKSWHSKIPPYISRHLSTKSFVEDSISPLLHILSPPTLRPVAFHLLSAKEKNDLAQLVSAMVSYSLTYKNTKSDPLLNNLGNEVSHDVSTLSFDPPINEFITFKGYRSNHYVLALAVKQVLVHEVEKQRIMQVTIGKSEHLADGYKENMDLAGEEDSKTESAKTNNAAVSAKLIEKSKSLPYSRQCNPSTSTVLTTLDSSRSSTASVKPKSSGDTKKSFRSSSSFFDRFRKLSGKVSQDTDNAVQKATVERDSLPLLFKFNEGFTNAVKRPVRMRDFLLS